MGSLEIVNAPLSSGKTNLMVRLLPELTRMGLRV